MQDYDKEMYAICEKMFNDIGIWGSSDLCRLIGYAEDSDDCYYIVKRANGKIVLHTMIGGFYSIKSMADGYEYIENQFKRNCPPEEEFKLILMNKYQDY